MRILGVNIPDNKHIFISLTYIYGIGKSLSINICKKLGININKKVLNLSSNEIDNIRNELNKYQIEGDLKRYVAFNIKKLINIRSYRGLRHEKKLPSRGQRTKTNARTCKGPKKKIKK